jgi:3-phosphoshikimate 1-carboxyvinyltransferase
MQIVINPSAVSGTVTAPASKSAMQRACAAALVRRGTSILKNPGTSADDKAAIGIIRQLGASVESNESEIIINSNGIAPVSDSIDCGESGLSVRMFTPVAALSAREIIINGGGSLVKRPLSFFDEILPLLGVKCSSNRGLLPLRVKGPLNPKDIEIDGSLSSQFLTGLLFAYSAAGASDVKIKVRNLNSKPYVDLTLNTLAAFGLKAPLNVDYAEFYFPAVSATAFQSDPLWYTVEGDWSGAAFLLVAGAIAGHVIIKGLDIFSSQADKEILKVLRQAGAVMHMSEGQIEIRKAPLKAFRFNATDCPDLFPPMVALASWCEGTSVIQGVHRLTHKESNRALTLQQEFGKMGVAVQLKADEMYITGGSRLQSCTVQSHHDHRIAMALAVAALNAEGAVTIEAAEAVNKSYPQFWQHLETVTK